MKSILRLFPITLLICVFSFVISVNANAAEVIDSGYCGGEGDGENLIWTLTNDGILRIQGTGVMADYTMKKAPWSCQRHLITQIIVETNVTSIGNNAFTQCWYSKVLIISDSVLAIGEEVFPESLSTISVDRNNSRYFSQNGILYDKTKSSLLHCPRNTSLTDITISDNIIFIEKSAFAFCSSLISVTIPDSVTSISEYSFYGCSSLISVTIPDSVTYISNSAFWGCNSLLAIAVNPNNTCYADIDGVLYSKDKTKLMYCPAGSSPTIITIPAGVTDIEINAFSDCTSLVTVAFPSSISSIGAGAFYYCSELTAITIPGSVDLIDTSTFWGCSSLATVTIFEGVSSIGYSSFSACSSLVSITLPDSITSIGEYAFAGCSSLESISLPDNITTIEGAAFSSCSSLRSVSIPQKVSQISNSVFRNCSSLTSITIPEGVSTIGYSAFEGCTELKVIEFDGNAPFINSNAFENIIATAYYPAENGTWTVDKLQDYGGDITWVPYTSGVPYHVHFSPETLPQEEFSLNLTVTSFSSKTDDVLFLVTYSTDGQMLALSTQPLSSDTVQTFTLTQDNTKGEIGCIKVFIVDNFLNPAPLVIPQGVYSLN